MVYEVVDQQAVLVDPDGVELVTLNEVATLVWESLDGRRGSAEIAAALIDRFEGVTLARLEQDITDFLTEIGASGLVRTGADDRG